MPLVLSGSSALPPPVTPCGSSSSPRASPPPAWLEAKSPAAPRASRPMSSPRPVSPSPSPRLIAPSSPPRPVCKETPPGSLVTPGRPLVVNAQLLPRTSGVPSAPTCLWCHLPSASPSSMLSPSLPRSSDSPSPPPPSSQQVSTRLPGL
ncbi:uncharacterized protein [Chanodichthys erythropterus]|uniref:uncharacterized protein n=1 Tax=Chanodichthys erythropterus TaxID=933992 RepID=UPI00351EF2A7